VARRDKEGGQSGYDSTPSIHTKDDTRLAGMPQHPVPPGGRMPDLGLAEFNVASGSSIQAMPDIPKPTVVWPALSGSTEMLGHDPTNPVPAAPNLAGRDGIPTSPAGMHGPDYGQPDWGSLNQSLQPGDFSNPVAADYRPENSTEPYSPTGTGYNHPTGLDIQTNPFAVDPVLSSYGTTDLPSGLNAISSPQANDPHLPDLQNPMIGLPVQMKERPGDTNVDGASRRERRTDRGLY